MKKLGIDLGVNMNCFSSGNINECIPELSKLTSFLTLPNTLVKDSNKIIDMVTPDVLTEIMGKYLLERVKLIDMDKYGGKKNKKMYKTKKRVKSVTRKKNRKSNKKSNRRRNRKTNRRRNRKTSRYYHKGGMWFLLPYAYAATGYGATAVAGYFGITYLMGEVAEQVNYLNEAGQLVAGFTDGALEVITNETFLYAMLAIFATKAILIGWRMGMVEYDSTSGEQPTLRQRFFAPIDAVESLIFKGSKGILNITCISINMIIHTIITYVLPILITMLIRIILWFAKEDRVIPQTWGQWLFDWNVPPSIWETIYRIVTYSNHLGPYLEIAFTAIVLVVSVNLITQLPHTIKILAEQIEEGSRLQKVLLYEAENTKALTDIIASKMSMLIVYKENKFKEREEHDSNITAIQHKGVEAREEAYQKALTDGTNKVLDPNTLKDVARLAVKVGTGGISEISSQLLKTITNGDNQPLTEKQIRDKISKETAAKTEEERNQMQTDERTSMIELDINSLQNQVDILKKMNSRQKHKSITDLISQGTNMIDYLQEAQNDASLPIIELYRIKPSYTEKFSKIVTRYDSKKDQILAEKLKAIQSASGSSGPDSSDDEKPSSSFPSMFRRRKTASKKPSSRF